MTPFDLLLALQTSKVEKKRVTHSRQVCRQDLPHWARMWIYRRLWRVASATPDLRLPSQSQSTNPLPVLISRPAEGRKLSCPKWLVAYRDGKLANGLSFPSNHHLSDDDCLEDKREDCQNCSVLCCVRQLCTMIRTHMRAVLKDECWFTFRFSFCAFVYV